MKSNRWHIVPKAILFIALIVFAITSTRAASWPGAITPNAQREVWITPGSSQGGNGTYLTPYTVANSSDFDAVMAEAIADGVKIFHLTPGTFYTKGYYAGSSTLGSLWKLPSGAKLIGSGSAESDTQGTFLVRDYGYVTGTSGALVPATMVQYDGSYIQISDLAIDCYGFNSAVSGSYLQSISAVRGTSSGMNYNEFRNITALRSFGRSGYPCRTFEIGGAANSGTLVERCVVTNSVMPGSGDADLDGFYVTGAATLRDCRAYLPTSSDIYTYGIVWDTVNGAKIDRCYVENCYYGVFNAAGSMTNCSILNSHFKKVRGGVRLKLTATGSVANNLETFIARGNLIEVASNVSYDRWGFFIQTGDGCTGRDVKVSENTIRYVDTTTPTGNTYAFSPSDWVNGLDNLTFLNNTIDINMWAYQGYYASGGPTAGNNTFYLMTRTLDGRLLPWENHNPMYPGKRHVITSTSDTIAADDDWVAARLSGTQTLSLPISGVDIGHTVTIVNDQYPGGTGTIIVNCPSGTIQPTDKPIYATSTTAMPPNAFARYMYLGYSTWQRN